MTYKVRVRGDTNSLKVRDYGCGRCDVVFYGLHVRNSDPNPRCDVCGLEMDRLVAWDGSMGGLDYGAGFYASTGREHTSSKDAEDYIISQRKTRPGEYIGDDRNGKKMYAAEIRNSGAEAHHGARNNVASKRKHYVPSAGMKNDGDAKRVLHKLLDERGKHG